MLERTPAALRRPLAGLWIIAAVGGIPSEVALLHLGLEQSELFFSLLVPFAIFIRAIGALPSASSTPAQLLAPAFLASLSACVPVPIAIWTVLLWRGGYEILDPSKSSFRGSAFCNFDTDRYDSGLATCTCCHIAEESILACCVSSALT